MYSLLVIVPVLFITWPFITWIILGMADRLFEGIDFPETSRFGISGDMYGSLNTLFSGLAFAAVVGALFLQRKEIESQGEQIKQQRSDIQSQIRLMDIQRFENFFYNQISIIRKVQEEVQTYEDHGRDAINMLYINCRRIESNIDSVYSLILFIIKNNNLNIEQKLERLEILKYSFLGEDWQILHSLGRLLNYNKIVEYLLDKELFEKDESIEKISEENIRFLQKEMNLKSNLSLNSCEIEL